jgi:hypothetical protein
VARRGGVCGIGKHGAHVEHSRSEAGATSRYLPLSPPGGTAERPTARHDRSTRPRAANRERRRAGVRPPQGPSRTRDTAVKKRQAAFAAAALSLTASTPLFSGRWPREARQRGRGSPATAATGAETPGDTGTAPPLSLGHLESTRSAPGAPRRADDARNAARAPEEDARHGGGNAGPCPTAGRGRPTAKAPGRGRGDPLSRTSGSPTTRRGRGRRRSGRIPHPCLPHTTGRWGGEARGPLAAREERSHSQ